ncbi:MAG TPA: outer membrane lipoprotein-sorting protein [Labilithrix sp.]|nr:outer membrane lipoprotein-sorting protein [Labilithrix sp.]
MKTRQLVIALSFAASASLVAADVEAGGTSPSAREVMTKNADASSFASLVTSSTLTIGATGGETRSKSFTLWRKVAADGVHHRTLTRFVAPAEIRGEGVLFDERTNGQNEVLLYLPRYKKVRRVEAQAQRSSFMGSSFSYADMTTMTTRAIDDHKHELVKTEPCPGDARASCFVIASTAANEAVKANHGYAKKTTWVRAGDFQTVQTELYDVDGALWKRIAFSAFREVDGANHRAMAYFVRVDDLKTKRFSTMKVEHADVARPIDDGMFNEQSLSREL